jgi:uncharacterized FAD-dependent dehydrogenase
MIQIEQLKMKPGHTTQELLAKAASVLGLPLSAIKQFEIIRRSIDARKKPDILFIYTVALTINKRMETQILRRHHKALVSEANYSVYHFPYERITQNILEGNRPVIVGTGPAGLFCGYFLAKQGYRPILLEQGQDVDSRTKDVERFWEGDELNNSSNVAFGEGGAGTFSDGKLNTLVKDKSGRNRTVLQTFVDFGADGEILYDAKPHLGTDVLCRIVKNMREEIRRLGGEVRFGSKLTGILTHTDLAGEVSLTGVHINNKEELSCKQLVLAIGHSARDTFSMLYETGMTMEAKAFAVGLRIEHPQVMLNRSLFGMEDPRILGAAPYKLTAQVRGKSVYSFCMCPGGYVVNASTEQGRLAINGMSYSKRDGENGNSALVVTVDPREYGSDHPLAGIEFARGLEERAYAIGQGKIPTQYLEDYVKANRVGLKNQEKNEENQLYQENHICHHNPTSLLWETQSNDDQIKKDLSQSKYEKQISPQIKGGYQFSTVNEILPYEYNVVIVEGISQFARKIEGFDCPYAILSGVESRTSSPVRILRGEHFQGSVWGVYPCGEGAGYAGGITSAAMDGIKAAEAVAGGWKA